ncbi:nucleotidyltransferase domain-containing protein [Akkermansia sp. N21169]|uniref:DNA polymerase beta superfamily protein n=1 Tax=Akkermansia sp. N21169 TaxID=3040765 RepID=UPI00244EC1A7|nr:nucleotidyltransferase domain-containing protein [Akkermansia sp. N21169]MDH3067858.1 nucleotidyltransferase domain-containing protein [Akkermansia sp. N21169]
MKNILSNITLSNISDHTLLHCIGGSHAYGLNTRDSDLDIRGVYQAPIKNYLMRQYREVVQDQKSDILFTELGKYLSQLCDNTPSALELLYTEKDCTKYRHPLFDEMMNNIAILSKKCRYTYGQYAYMQVKKATSINKKAVHPVERCKGLDEFSYVLDRQYTYPFRQWFEEYRHTHPEATQETLALCKLDHAENMYCIYEYPSKGIFSKTRDNVILTSVPSESKIVGYISINFQEYARHCREYREYQEWLAKRNEKRFITNCNTIVSGTYYDTKNMMHTFRIMETAIEIAREGRIFVNRSQDRDFLLSIRNGQYKYEELLKMIDDKNEEMIEAFEHSTLPETPETNGIKEYLLEFYGL